MNNLGIDTKYFEQVGKKNCPTIYDEINSYHPKEINPPPDELIAFRKIRCRETEKQKKFYSQIFIQEYFDEKWKREIFNRDCFLRLYELIQVSTDARERTALQTKLDQFKRVIEKYSHPYMVLALNFAKYGMKTIQTNHQEVMNALNEEGWDD